MSFVTVLRSTWAESRAFKFWPVGSTDPEDYKLGQEFIGVDLPCDNIHALHEILKDLQDERQCILVRGALNPDVENPRRRSFSKIEDDPAGLIPQESRLVALDIDSAQPPGDLDFLESVAWVRSRLGHIWEEAACVAQATGKCSMPGHGFRCRLWYWARRGISDADLRARLRGLPIKVDVSVCVGTQPIYTAPPEFEEPERNPFKERIFFVPGADELDIDACSPVEAVDLPSDAAPITIDRQWSRMELLSCDREMDRWETRLEQCRSDRPNTLLKAASRLARLVVHGWSDRESVERRLVGAYAASYGDETEGGTREAGIDESTLTEALSLIAKGFRYATSNPEVIKPPRGLKEADVKKAKSQRGTAIRNIAENPSLLNVFTPNYAEQISKGLIGQEKAVAELRDALIKGGMGGGAAQEASERELTQALTQVKKEESAKWMDGLQMSGEGQIRNILGNVLNVIQNHPHTKDTLYFNERTLEVWFVKNPPWYSPIPAPRVVKDADAAYCAGWLTSGAINMVDAKESMAHSAICALSLQNSGDPFKEYLESLEWDGKYRLDSWIIDYLGAEETEFNRLAGAKTLIGAVARTMEPGCQMDTMLVLEGTQGATKTTLLKALVGREEWYASVTGKGSEKDSIMQFHGPVVVEMPEMSQLRSWEIEHAKALITTSVDRFRPPFGRTVQSFRRRSIFVGTTNEEVYLKDVTGNRRFWPVAVTTVDLEGVRVDRDQLWAEAYVRYQAKEQWWLTPAQEILAKEVQESRRERDPVEEAVVLLFEKKLTVKQLQLFPEIEVDQEGLVVSITTRELAGLLPNFIYDKGGQTKLGNALRALGWTQKKTSKSGKTVRRHYRP